MSGADEKIHRKAKMKSLSSRTLSFSDILGRWRHPHIHVASLNPDFHYCTRVKENHLEEINATLLIESSNMSDLKTNKRKQYILSNTR